MEIKTMLEEEIKHRLKDLGDMETADEDYGSAVDKVAKLVDRKIEMDKLDIERTEKVENQKIEQDFKERQMKEEKIDRLTKNILAGANLAIGAGMFIWGTVASINFEREGTFTTTAGRKNVNRVLSWFK